ncbi:anhydro-N-acetylmuramic acid kinase [Neptunicoccus cionae]|uniref:Anhydro-N-acetylmuramic acid kinase n=1 Tax=Neptunicoccus cionae TaxID=2035344 RepID=A0A916QUD2_9RHOB|nr:anhydro-N-acetylmuramic acid kinase [Amylibacter cionae]GGA11791.1 anhydro-N-acetylmuramic acid kinase [Amylibacter cionae]
MTEFKPIRALGLMSGTSMDGVDGAVLTTDGAEIHDFGESAFRPFTKAEAEVLRTAQGLWPGENPAVLQAALEVIQTAHADLVLEFDDIDLVGFHGQTLNHDPEAGRTFQLGDGADLARRTGVPTVWDFRSNDMVLDGQGAPLAPFFHFACAKWAGLTEPAAFLNLGGVGNVTLVDPSKNAPEDTEALIAFDTGPANAPLNDMMTARLGKAFDENGSLAASGKVDETVLTRVYQRAFFAQKPPKSLDRHDFHDVLSLVDPLCDADAAATLTALPAACVAANQSHLTIEPEHWFICGGGACNPVMMQELSNRLSGTVAPISELGLDGDMLEAQAFAYLAVRSRRALPLSAPSTTGCRAPATGGRFNKP